MRNGMMSRREREREKNVETEKKRKEKKTENIQKFRSDQSEKESFYMRILRTREKFAHFSLRRLDDGECESHKCKAFSQDEDEELLHVHISKRKKMHEIYGRSPHHVIWFSNPDITVSNWCWMRAYCAKWNLSFPFISPDDSPAIHRHPHTFHSGWQLCCNANGRTIHGKSKPQQQQKSADKQNEEKFIKIWKVVHTKWQWTLNKIVRRGRSNHFFFLFSFLISSRPSVRPKVNPLAKPSIVRRQPSHRRRTDNNNELWRSWESLSFALFPR